MSEDMVWALTFVGCCVVFAVAQLWWTRQHAKNLREHNERMERIYEKYKR